MSQTPDPAGFAQTEVRNPRLYGWALGIVTLVLIAPIWTFGTLPWQDYGDHLARVYIFAHYQDVPRFQREFDILAEPLPNLAMDAIATPLLWVLPVNLVAHLFPSILILIFVAGCHLFARAVHGAFSWLVLPAVFLIYNILLMWGFLNYVFSTGLFLIAAASWMRFQRQPTIRRGTWASVAALATYFAHLSGFFFLCVFVGSQVVAAGFKALRSPKSGFLPRALALLLPLAPGLALYGYLLVSGQLGNGVVIYSSLPDKLMRIWTVFGSYVPPLDILVAIVVLGAIALALLDGRLRIPASMGAVILIFCAMYLAFPVHFHTSFQVDARFLLPAVVLFPLSLSIRMPRIGARLAYGLVMAAMLLRLGAISRSWQLAEKETLEQRKLLAEVEPESLVYALPLVPDEEGLKMSLLHVAGYATLDRNAVVSTTFGVPGQQMLRWREAPPEPDISKPALLSKPDWDRVLERFDYIWLYNPPPELIAFIEPNIALVGQAGQGRLYKVKRSK